MAYGTGQQIRDAAFFAIGSDLNSAWMDAGRVLAILNEAAEKIQRITGHYTLRETKAFAAAAEYVEWTGQNPRLFKLLGVYYLSLYVADYDKYRVSFAQLRKLRDGLYTSMPTTGEYWFALNLRPLDSAFGTVRLEVYPAAPAAGLSVEVETSRAYPEITTLTETILLPRDAMSKYLAWQGATIEKPKDAERLKAEFYEALVEDSAAGSLTGVDELAEQGDWLNARSIEMDR